MLMGRIHYYTKKLECQCPRFRLSHMLHLLEAPLSIAYIHLKGIYINFTYTSVSSGLGESCCICQKCSIKPFVAQEEAACNLIYHLQGCHSVALWVM